MKSSPLIDVAARLWGSTAVRVVDEHARHAVFIAKTTDGAPVFIKATADKTQVAQLKNEAKANLFLRDILDQKRFKAPDPLGEVRSDGEIHAIAFEFLEVDWFATKFPKMHLLRPVTDMDLDDIAALTVALHHVPKADVPEYFLQRAATEFTDGYSRDKQQEYLTPVLRAGYIDDAEEHGLISLASTGAIERHLVHHDIVPWNLGRDSKGRLVTADAEFLRYGRVYYDVAYTFLQTFIMLGDADLARRGLRCTLAAFGLSEVPPDHPLWRAMAYRLSGNLNVALTYPDQMRAARMLVVPVLARDFKALFVV